MESSILASLSSSDVSLIASDDEAPVTIPAEGEPLSSEMPSVATSIASEP